MQLCNSRLTTYLLALVIILASAAQSGSFAQNARKVQSPVFFEVLQDIPVMPGLHELTEESVMFDKPEGRIIESTAVSEQLTGEQISSFYNQTLTQMGWRRIGPDSFVRNGESLILKLEKQSQYSIVRFMVTPSPSKP